MWQEVLFSLLLWRLYGFYFRIFYVHFAQMNCSLLLVGAKSSITGAAAITALAVCSFLFLYIVVVVVVLLLPQRCSVEWAKYYC